MVSGERVCVHVRQRGAEGEWGEGEVRVCVCVFSRVIIPIT